MQVKRVLNVSVSSLALTAALTLGAKEAALAQSAPQVDQIVSKAQPVVTPVADRTDGEQPKGGDAKKLAASSREKAKKKPVSPIPTVNLINALVAKGALTEAEGEELIRQAEEQAYVAQESARVATEKAETAEATANKVADQVPAKGARRVSYVPEVVKNQIREDVRKDVMSKAQSEGWAAPGQIPAWTRRITVYGDVRTRYEGVFFPGGNAFGPFLNTDFHGINTGSPYDVNPDSGILAPIPSYNVDQNRNRFRLRARVGLDAQLPEGFYVGTRLASGDSNSPVSTNQTLGGSPGNFAKYQFWLDQAYLAYKLGDLKSADSALVAQVGRFANPFFTHDLVWDSDVNFDGAALTVKADPLDTGISWFVTGGAFPVFNTSFNLSNSDDALGTTKRPSDDRYLYAAQTGLKTNVEEVNSTFALGAAYYDFSGITGEISSPCNIYLAKSVGCSTDVKRPSFAQKGNSYMPLRNIYYPDVTTHAEPQYFGLAAEFNELVITARADFGYFSPFHIVLDGEFVKNLGFDRSKLKKTAINNYGPATYRIDETGRQVLVEDGVFEGGDTGWMARLTVGSPKVQNLWDWNVYSAYRYLESDAVVDAFADSDFGLGGTNLKGFIVGGQLGLGKNVWSELKWLSADNIAGPKYAVDVVQVDLNARF